MKLLVTKDLYNTCAYASLAPIAFTFPQTQFQRVAENSAALISKGVGPRGSHLKEYQSLIGDRLPDVHSVDVFKAALANIILERFYLLSCYRRSGWHPTIRFEGSEHLNGALTLGRGAILWVVPFRFSDLVTKIAFAREGIDVSHLSRFSHPGSNSAIGSALLNPIRTKIETRYLAERLVIERDHKVRGEPPLAALTSRLKKNGVVSITVGKHGRQKMSVPMLDGEVCLATGPAHLALKTSAPLLPVFTIRRDDGTFETTIGPKLDVSPDIEPDDQIKGILADYAERLAMYPLKWPDQFPWGHFSG